MLLGDPQRPPKISTKATPPRQKTVRPVRKKTKGIVISEPVEQVESSHSEHSHEDSDVGSHRSISPPPKEKTPSPTASPRTGPTTSLHSPPHSPILPPTSPEPRKSQTPPPPPARPKTPPPPISPPLPDLDLNLNPPLTSPPITQPTAPSSSSQPPIFTPTEPTIPESTEGPSQEPHAQHFDWDAHFREQVTRPLLRAMGALAQRVDEQLSFHIRYVQELFAARPAIPPPQIPEHLRRPFNFEEFIPPVHPVPGASPPPQPPGPAPPASPPPPRD